MFILMLLVGVLPGVIGVASVYFMAKRLALNSAAVSLAQIAEKASEEIDILFKQKLREAEMLSRDLELIRFVSYSNERYFITEIDQGKAVKAIEARPESSLMKAVLGNKAALSLKKLINKYPDEYCHAFVADKKGKLIASTIEVPNKTYFSEKWWKGAMQGKPVIGGPHECNIGRGHYYFFFAVPVIDPRNNSPMGVLYIERHTESVLSTLGMFQYGQTGHIELFNVSAGKSIVIVESSGIHGIEGEPIPERLIKEITGINKGWITGEDTHGRNALIGFAPTSINNWHVVLSQDLDEIYQPMWGLVYWASIPGFLTVFILALIWFNLSRKMILNPISKLNEGARQIGYGHLEHRLEIRTVDELEELATEFNTMAENLSVSQEKLRRWNDDLREEVKKRTSELEDTNKRLKTSKEELQGSLHQVMMLNDELETNKEELKRRNDELAGANLRLREMDRLKSEFLANMSHELRTPLTAIIGFSELLVDGAMGEMNDEQADCVEDILTSGQHLLKLINNILDLSKIEAGKMDLHPELFNLGTITSFIKKTVASLIEKKKQILKIEIAEGLPEIYADPGKIKQLLLNLVGNAIKFTPDGGTITIGANFKDNCFEISVTDTGIGIKPEDMERIFQEFQQGEGSTSREYEGTGLGLALTRKLTEMHGGKLELESQVGRWSKFTAYIPLTIEKNAYPKKDEIKSDAEPYVAQERAEPPVGRDFQPLILVVEDDPKLSRLLSVYLAQAGYRIEVAMDGDEALKKAVDLKPYAITLDIMLSKKDGWEVMQELSAMPETRDIPVIIVSMVENQELGLSLGALDYLVKPVSREALLGSLEGYSSKIQNKKGVKNVLVVDDDLETLEFLSTILKKEGYNVRSAAGGREGLIMASEQSPDVIVLDLLMPNISGFDVIRELKKHPDIKEIPIIIFTAKDLTRAEKDVLLEDVAKIVRKGEFSSEGLIDEIRRIRS